MTSLRRLPYALILLACLLMSEAQNSRYVGWNDRFTYQEESIYRPDGFVDWAPSEWDQISCNEGKKLDQCLAYRDKWYSGRDWKIVRNDCEWCPEGSGNCGRHHQSPINLRRESGFPLDYNHELVNECIDLHWISYQDSLCTFDQLRDRDAFTIERHALRTSYPLYLTHNAPNTKVGNIDDGWVVGTENTVHLDCPIQGRGPRFPRMDYSKGFSDYWYLSHVDIHVPSEHTQDGLRFDAEVQMQHFYTLAVGVVNEKGQPNENEMGSISVFLQAFDDAPPNPYLDKLICEWRRKEQEVIDSCPNDVRSTPVPSYPGCPDNRKLLRNEGKPVTKSARPYQTVFDVLQYNHFNSDKTNHSDVKIDMDPSNWEEAEDKDWDKWFDGHSVRMQEEQQLYQRLLKEKMGQNGNVRSGRTTFDTVHEQYQHIVYGDSPWSDYWPMLSCKTEYYFRYQGSGTIPPCYGKNEKNKRTGVNHWRVMKDPAKINPKQLVEMKRLIAERIAANDGSTISCQPDTAAVVSPEGDVSTARPLQDFSKKGHKMSFCECKNWGSKWPEDRKWCEINDINDRFFIRRFNWDA